jgi:choline kinase/mannose-6-phosphate isomerase-like protein (cupin superfamily)
MIDYICILAGGKGVRLHPLTFHIPKILVNLHNENILSKIINFWKAYCKKFILIVNPEYADFINFYCKEHTDIQYELRYIEINNEENSYAIKQTLTGLDNKSVLITWCDVFPTQDIDPKVFETNIIFVNNFSNYKSRYIADGKKSILEKVTNYLDGNVVGIFFIKNFKTLENSHNKQDFCDCFIQNYGSFTTHHIELIDIGDKEKLTAYFKEEKHIFPTRYFNRITFHDSYTLKKESICDYGDEIIKKELELYTYVQEKKLAHPFPKFSKISETSFLLEYVKGETLFTLLKKTHDPKIIFDLLIFLKGLYNSTETTVIPFEDMLRDIEEETTAKIQKRYANVSQILEHFKDIKYCNYIQIESRESLQLKLQEKIRSLLEKVNPSYKVIHGDLNLSNIFYTNPYTFIDPRGYYGKSKLHGLPYYDYAKIYFSLLGFDDLNFQENYFFSIEEDNILPNISPFFKELPIFSNIFTDDEYELILCIAVSIWLGLPFYFKDNLSKVIGSYFHARYIGTLFLQSLDDLVKAKRIKRYSFYNEISLQKSQKDIDVMQRLQQKTLILNTQPFNYKNKLIKKPWGGEFVVFETKDIALLCLHMHLNSSTSLHCHEKKDTSFIIAQGNVCVHTLGSSFYLVTGDTCFIPRGVFHRIESLATDTIVLEFEIKNPNRSDLYRLSDNYNRENLGYEGIENMISDITSNENPDYFEFNVSSKQICMKAFKKSALYFQSEFMEYKDTDIFVVVKGYVVVDGKYMSSGSFLRGSILSKKSINYYDDFCCVHFEYTI